MYQYKKEPKEIKISVANGKCKVTLRETAYRGCCFTAVSYIALIRQ